MPWVTPRHPRTHTCKPPRVERPWLHGLVRVGDEWRCGLCGTCHVVDGTERTGVGRSVKRLMWRKINDG